LVVPISSLKREGEGFASLLSLFSRMKPQLHGSQSIIGGFPLTPVAYCQSQWAIDEREGERGGFLPLSNSLSTIDSFVGVQRNLLQGVEAWIALLNTQEHTLWDYRVKMWGGWKDKMNLRTPQTWFPQK
jgi:hypothetical protein